MKYRIALAVAALAAAAHAAISAAEEALYRLVGNVQATAWEHGVAAEQATVNKAKANLDAARKQLEQVNKVAQAVLKAHPERVEAVRAKVFG